MDTKASPLEFLASFVLPGSILDWFEVIKAEEKAVNPSEKDKYQADEKIIGTGIIAEAHLCGLDPTDEHQRKKAANSLIGKVDWKGTTPFAGEVAKARTCQLSDEMIVTKEIVAGLLLAASGRGISGSGGGDSNSDLTNWGWNKEKERVEQVELIVPEFKHETQSVRRI